MTVLALSVAMLAADIGPLLKAVEARYNAAKTLEVVFSETYVAPGKPKRTEAGVLSLRKPGRMRWEYSQPAGKLFVADGKYFYLYSPSSQRVTKTKAKQSEDMHAPLAFLLGRLNFAKDFREFTARPDGDGTWVSAIPKSDQLPYTRVDFRVVEQGKIAKVNVYGQDQSVLEFTFGSEKRNPALAEALFQFTPPAGAEVVEAAN